MRPVVGVTTRVIAPEGLGVVLPGATDAPLWGVFAEYCESVSAAGGLPMMLARSADPIEAVGHLDALLLSGGEDVQPHRYGGVDDPAITYDRERDEFELALTRAALDAGIPILAICRGCQLLNVVLGGTLVAHLDDADFDHAWSDEHRSVRRHPIEVTPGSILAQVLADELVDGRTSVNSYHHQAVLEPGDQVQVTARAHDGTIEAFELAGRDVLAVQWHPEMQAGTDPVFPWLIRAAARNAREQRS